MPIFIDLSENWLDLGKKAILCRTNTSE